MLGVLACRALARWRVARARSLPAAQLWAALGTEPDGRPTVVAFSTPSCAECGLQARVLEQLERIRVLHVDAAARPEVASTFGILTAPSTAVLAPSGHLLTVNHGLADGARLGAQLAEA